MSKVKKIFKSSDGLRQFSLGYFQYLNEMLSTLDQHSLNAFAEELEDARQNNRTIFFVGNGGSAGTASHMVNDFGVGIRKIDTANSPIRALALTDNSPVMLAVANDDGYDQLFVRQLDIHWRTGDKLVAISASGNSPNVVKAAEWVKERGGVVISLLGFDGGILKEISDIVLLAQSEKGDYGPVEDVHVVIGHLLANWLVLKGDHARN